MERIAINKIGLRQSARRDNKMEQLSGVMIIIIIGGGVLTFVMLFIFAKRQIMRFTLRSRRGPHVPVGNDAKKGLRREIERRLDCIQKIAQEPKLLWLDDKYIMQKDHPLPPYYYRMQAVDDVKILEKEIARNDGSTRHAYESLRAFLLTTLAGTMNGSGQRMIHQFCDMYEHARHDPNEFGSEEYGAYHRLLLKMIDAAKQLKGFNNSRKTSPSRTPKKQTKMHSLLDPSRLRPPSFTGPDPSAMPQGIGTLGSGQHSKVNLTLGLQRDIDAISDKTQSIHKKAPRGQDLITRSCIKTSTLRINGDDGIYDRNRYDDGIARSTESNENEIMNISSTQSNNNASVV